MTVKPEIGMGATERVGSDCYAYTVIEVTPSGKRATVQRDKAIATKDNSFTEEQEYRYESDPQGVSFEVSLRKNGKWYRVGQPMEWYTGVTMGHRRYYSDPSF